MVIAIITVILGLVSARTLPIAQYPEITPPQVNVQGTYTGANAVAVEQSVATAIEQKINGVENMIYMKSVNSGDGKMGLTVSFEVGTDLDIANVLVQNRVSEAEPSLPEEVKRLGLAVKKKLSFPLLLVTLYSPNSTYDATFLNNYATININDEISRIQGVGQVSIFGSEYAMRVWVEPDRLARLGLTIPDLTRAIGEQNVLTPAGKIGAPPAPPGTEFTFTVQTKGRLSTAEEFAEIVVRSNPDGSQVLLGDVARIELGAQFYNQITRYNGAPAAVMAVYQLPGANGLEVAKNIVTALDQLSARFPDGLEYVISLDTTKPIEAGIQEIFITLFQAIALVVLVVFVFLQNFRTTLIPTLAVPVALIGTFAVFPLLGFSINTLSLLGLVLAIGTVVDDAIVVVEAVSEKMARGLSAKDATVATMKEVTGPVIATTLVLIAVFVPVAAMAGITGRLYQQFAITIAISVALSSINALTLSPALASTLLKPPSEQKSFLDGFYRLFNRIFDKATTVFLAVTAFFTRKVGRAALALALVTAGLVVLFGMVPGGFVPEEDQAYVLVNVQLPDAASLQRTDAAVKKVEEILAAESSIESFTTVAGYSLLSESTTSNTAFLFVQLKDWDERPEAQDHATAVARRLTGIFARRIPEGFAIAFGPPAIPGLGSGSGFSLMIQDRGGNSPEYLAAEMSRFIQAARERPELTGLFSTYRANVPQYYLYIDRQKALKLGVSIADVNTTLGAFFGGAYVNDFNRFGRLYKVYVQAEPEYRTDREKSRLFFVRNREQEMVPLATLMTGAKTSGPEFTNRFNLFRSAEITGQPAAGYTSAQALDALEEVADEVLPSDFSYAWNAMSYQEKDAAGSGGVVILMALHFVFLILAAQNESWKLPFAILFGTPVAIFGAMLGLWIARQFSSSYENNVFAQIGLVMLIGLAAKNAILIVEFAKVETEKGKDPVEAALEAARLRFRPIVMTALSFILGVLPLLIAQGAGAEARKVMGMTVFSGMVVATLVGVVLVPGLYVLVEKYLGRSRVQTPASPASDPSGPEYPGPINPEPPASSSGGWDPSGDQPNPYGSS